MTDAKHGRTRPLVLIVDDDATMRLLETEALEQAGYDTVQASNGLEALNAYRSESPDIVLLDIKMPKMDGFAACEAIQRLPGGGRTPVVMMTGLDDVESIDRAYEIGATDFVTKPIHYHVLTHRVRYILRARETADALQRRDAELGRAQQVARFGHYKWDLDSRTLSLSDAAAAVLGVNAGPGRWYLDELLQLIHEDDRQIVRETLEHCLKEPRSYQFEHRLIDDDGSESVVRHEAEVDLDDSGDARWIIGILQDVTTQRRAQARIHYLAYFDSLTDLPNRALVKELLRNALVNARRRGQCTAVLFCDLDGFKQINESFGYELGDSLLKAVASRLRNSVRCGDSSGPADLAGHSLSDSDRVRDVVARIGGDEFVVVLTEVRRAEDSVKALKRVQGAFAEPFLISKQRIAITMTVGASVSPQDGDDIDTLLRNADSAMHQAKQNGRNSSQFYTDAINARAAKRFSLENSLHQALGNDEFLLHYQPKIDLRDGTPTGVEALIRWQNQEQGLVSPADFIPLAEETGLIVPIGEWVLRTACKQIKDWQTRLDSRLSLAVNLSARQFREPGLVECIRSILEDADVRPESVELELTESLLMQDIERCMTLMHAIREMGSRLAIDDFGTGYSSLGYLKRFPINTFKIDRTFIRDLEHDKRDGSIVSAMILMAHELGLQVVAEGVETEAQAEFLRELSCDAAQGFLFSRPLGPQDCEAWLTRTEPAAVAACVVEETRR